MSALQKQLEDAQVELQQLRVKRSEGAAEGPHPHTLLQPTCSGEFIVGAMEERLMNLTVERDSLSEKLKLAQEEFRLCKVAPTKSSASMQRP